MRLADCLAQTPIGTTFVVSGIGCGNECWRPSHSSPQHGLSLDRNLFGAVSGDLSFMALKGIEARIVPLYSDSDVWLILHCSVAFPKLLVVSSQPHTYTIPEHNIIAHTYLPTLVVQEWPKPYLPYP